MRHARRVWAYLRSTADDKITYRRTEAMADVPMAFCDASFAPGGKTGFGWRRSRSGIVITLNGAAVLWLSKCQTCVAMSTCEAEYIALSRTSPLLHPALLLGGATVWSNYDRRRCTPR